MADVAKRGTPQLVIREQQGEGVYKFKEGQGIVKLKVPPPLGLGKESY
jgi:hypothetical protein